MRYGLSKQTIAKICAVFANHPVIDKAVLYGSRAKGNFWPGSDIDLSLHGAGLSLKELGDIDFELDDLLIFDYLDRARETWQKHGRSEKWIQQRMTGQETRNKLTDYRADHDINKGEEFAILTNIILDNQKTTRGWEKMNPQPQTGYGFEHQFKPTLLFQPHPPPEPEQVPSAQGLRRPLRNEVFLFS